MGVERWVPDPVEMDLGKMKVAKLIHPRNPPMTMMWPVAAEGKLVGPAR